jgi:hypothetical protein
MDIYCFHAGCRSDVHDESGDLHIFVVCPAGHFLSDIIQFNGPQLFVACVEVRYDLGLI